MSFLHNINFYINIIKGLDKSLIFNVFPTYINTFSNMGYLSFEPSVVPHLFLYIPALFNHFLNDISLSLNIFLILINILEFLSMFICMLGISKKKLPSFLSALLYVSIFLLTINNSIILGLAEHIALIFVPLLIYALNNIYYGDSKKSLLLIFALFSIGESSILIFVLSIAFILIYGIINIINSIFKLKIFTLILYIIVSILLLTFTYIPIIDYYYTKQINICDIIGDNSVIITTVVFFVLTLLYILISKIIINHNNKKALNIALSIIISLIGLASIVIYISVYTMTERLVINDTPYEELHFIPHITEEYLIKNEKIYNDMYTNDGYGYFNIFVNDYTEDYLQMNINYETSDKFDEFFLDTPFYYIKGLRASDDNEHELKTMFSEEGLMRVFVPKGKGIIHTSYKKPIIYEIANIISIITLILTLIIISVKELKDFKGKIILTKEPIEYKAPETTDINPNI